MSEEPVTLAVIDLSFHRATAAVVRRILEAHGHEVRTVEAPHEAAFGLLAEGRADVLVSAWLPASHGTYLAACGDAVQVLPTHYAPYCLWAVPPYVPAGPVREIGDLARPDVARRFTRIIDGINPGAGISRFSVRAVEEYGLGRQGYAFVPGTESTFTERVERGIAAGEWFVVPLWRPQYLNLRHGLRPLGDPRGVLGGVDAARPVVRREAAGRLHPAALAQLENLWLGNEGVEAIDLLAHSGHLTPVEAADRYRCGRSGPLGG
ncbi:glycine betaine ABC transporter substrate-binding protein [Streptomyces caatingaensis]|uniref:Glycine/betaine ABC transporter substrate-binding protein n=1 Tax=Streptomyces caatingaensis TaxID=1678637 RepID=A0A0K9XBQ1_9ACTN|nr:glycine betaine ABC transporter substrate-binding protein [Streptomyces caatingaensis]KNB50829.1 glycine/betaine ABC transporter substrate-binding protein [Streptomyces caatingaensis]